MRKIEPILIIIFIVGLVPPRQERGERLDVAPVIDLVAPHSQETDTEQQLDLAELHDEDSHTGASDGKVLLLLITIQHQIFVNVPSANPVSNNRLILSSVV